MNYKSITKLMVLLLFLPVVSAQVKIQLGEPYVNIGELSEIEFTAHSDYYEICSLDETVIPVLIKNKNKFPDTFEFDVDKEYASLSVRSAVLKSGKSALLLLTVRPPAGMEEDTTLVLDIITKEEGLKRSVIIKTNIRECYLFELDIAGEEEICGCDKETYNIILQNNGEYTDIFTLTLDVPDWVNFTLKNDTITLYDGQKREIELGVSPSCEEKGTFTIGVKAVSEKSEVTLEDELKLDVLPQDECYNTVIIADNVDIDYFGKNIPITIKNKGAKDADYSLSVEGIDWYTLSQAGFSLDKNKEKTINLALYPDKGVVEGEYNIDIKAESGEQEFTKSVTVKLKRKGAVLEKISFYINYFKYYIGVGVVLLVIILFLIVLIRKRAKKEGKKRQIVEDKEVKKEEKVVEKKAAKKVKKARKRISWLPIIIPLISLVLFALFIYSTFKYRSYYEKALNFISGLFAGYIVPYGNYLKYAVAGAGALIIVILTIKFFREKTRRKAVSKKKKAVEEKSEEKPKEEKKEVKKVGEKLVKKRRLKLFEYIYLILVMVLFLAIAGYSVYRFSGKSAPVGKLALAMGFVKAYALYFIIGVVVLLLLILLINFLRKKKSAKKAKKKINKKLRGKIKNISIIIAGLIVLSGVIYSFVYYGLISYIRDFSVVYYPYILMGIGILAILVLILHFQSKKIS